MKYRIIKTFKCGVNKDIYTLGEGIHGNRIYYSLHDPFTTLSLPVPIIFTSIEDACDFIYNNPDILKCNHIDRFNYYIAWEEKIGKYTEIKQLQIISEDVLVNYERHDVNSE